MGGSRVDDDVPELYAPTVQAPLAGRAEASRVSPAVVSLEIAAIGPVALLVRSRAEALPANPADGTPAVDRPVSHEPNEAMECPSHEHAACHPASVLEFFEPYCQIGLPP